MTSRVRWHKSLEAVAKDAQEEVQDRMLEAISLNRVPRDFVKDVVQWFELTGFVEQRDDLKTAAEAFKACVELEVQEDY